MSVPIIQLFRTINCYYVLDGVKCKLLEISEESYDRLKKLLISQEKLTLQEISNKEIDMLIEAGYLSVGSPIQEVKHLYTPYLALFLERKVNKITLQLTQKCNFRCKYCVYSENVNKNQRQHSNLSMSWKRAKEAIDFLWAHSVDSHEVNIGFYGGEPLLEYDLIKKSIAYAQKIFQGKKLRYSITTNGTLLTDDKIKYFQDHEVSLMISLDGPKEINDANRVFQNGEGTFDVVVGKIKYIQDNFPRYADNLQISMVIDPENDFDCINEISIPGREYAHLNINPSLVDKDYDGIETTVSEAYLWKYEYQNFLAILSFWGRYPEDKVSPIALRSFNASYHAAYGIENAPALKPTDAPSGPCIPGQLRLFVDVNGRLFPCERVSESSDSMSIGNIYDGFHIEKALKILNIGSLTEMQCKQCWCFRYCNLCAKKADIGKLNLSGTEKLSHCMQAKSAAYLDILNYLLMREIPQIYGNQISREKREMI